MSTYGRLWEQVAEIRAKLVQTVPSASVNSLVEARQSLRSVSGELDALLERWASLEQEMARLDDSTGEPLSRRSPSV